MNELLQCIEEDYKRVVHKPGNVVKYLRGFFSLPGFRAVVLYRLGHWFYVHHRYRLTGFCQRLMFHLSSCEISTTAEIGMGLYVPHPFGLVVGDSTRVGNYCSLRQNVTLGGNFGRKDINGRSQPWIGDNVSVGAGAVIAGPVRIGSNGIIGANSVVITDMPDNFRASGIPAQVRRRRSPSPKFYFPEPSDMPEQ